LASGPLERRRGAGGGPGKRRLAHGRRGGARLHPLLPDPASAAGGRGGRRRHLDAARGPRRAAERVPEGGAGGTERVAVRRSVSSPPVGEKTDQACPIWERTLARRTSIGARPLSDLKCQ